MCMFLYYTRKVIWFVLGEFPQGCTVFRTISPNVESEESGMRDDSGMQDVAYTEVGIDITCVCVYHTCEL